MTYLLDGNVLVALVVADHEHHARARSWFLADHGTFATCPITQGTLLRFLVRAGTSASSAIAALDRLTSHPRHAFWSDDLPYSSSMLGGVVGHRQVTDAYLAGLARRRDGLLLTLDKGLAALHHDSAELL